MKSFIRAGGALLLILVSFIGWSALARAAVSFALTPEQPTLTAGESATFMVTKKDGDASTDVTDQATFTTTDPRGAITGPTYHAGQAGSWAVQATVEGEKLETSVSVSAGPVNRLRIVPHDNPVVVTVGEVMRFSVQAFDAFNNEVVNPSVNWSGGFSVGTIDNDGSFHATRVGSSQIIASSNDVIDTVTVTIDPKKAPAEESSAQPSNTDQAAPPTEPVEENEEPAAAPVAETSSEPACTTLPWWGWLLASLGFLILLHAYHLFIRRKPATWLIVTGVATSAAVWLYFAFRCTNQYTWVVWLLILGGAVVTIMRPRTFKSQYGEEL